MSPACICESDHRLSKSGFKTKGGCIFFSGHIPKAIPVIGKPEIIMRFGAQIFISCHEQQLAYGLAVSFSVYISKPQVEMKVRDIRVQQECLLVIVCSLQKLP